MKIFLIGLPGSGKSTLGKQLAGTLRLPFVDLDEQIEKREGRPIREIFREQKEDYFRRIEAEELKRWCERPDSFVMATGGGAPCFHNSLQLINASGISVFLDVPAAEIARRMATTKVEERPTLAAGGLEGLEGHIDQMRSNRLVFYSMAKFTFSGNQIEPGPILAAIRK